MLYSASVNSATGSMEFCCTTPGNPASWGKEARDAGLPGVVQQNSMDPVAEFTLAEYNMFDYMPHWIQPLVGSPAERAAKLRDPAARQAMKDDVVKFPHARTDWDTMTVVQVKEAR